MAFRTLFTTSVGFEAARQIHHLPLGHRSARLHGHSFLADVRCALPPTWAHFPGAQVTQLRQAVEQRVAELDYQLLNEQIEHPSDENLARWLRDALDVPGVVQIGIQSTLRQGVRLTPTQTGGEAVQAWRRYAIQAAHRLPHVPMGHKCGRMHGHGFEIILHAHTSVSTSAQSTNSPRIDHDRLNALWAPLHMELNYACLNDLPGLHNPTSEVLSSWLWERLAPQLPELARVTVYETASCGASYDGQRYRIWKDLTLDSAVQLKRAPEGHALRRIHGHTYTLRLHLSAPLDTVMGWTVDFGDVKEIFTPLFRALDHHPLHHIEGLQDCDTASIARWILEQSRPQLPQLYRVDLYETNGCGAIVSGAQCL